MQKLAFFFFAIVVMVLMGLPIQAAPVSIVNTSAVYDTYTDSDSDTSFDLAMAAEAHAHTWLPGESSDYGKSDGWATIGGSVRAYSRAQGAYGGEITTSADTMHTTEWIITSDTLGAGTPVLVFLDISFDGSLRSRSTTSASASASFDLGDTTLYEGSGISGYYSALNSTGAWSGDFTSSSSTYYLDTTDQITFETEVGQLFSLKLFLHTEAYVSVAMESGATADFSNSGSYAFAGAEDPDTGASLDVQFELVPEPGTVLLLGLGAMMFRREQ